MNEKLARLMMRTSYQMLKTSKQMMRVYGKENDNAKELKGASTMLARWAVEAIKVNGGKTKMKITNDNGLYTYKYGIFAKGEPLSYGRHNEPEPGLLLKRGRLDVFDTKDSAVNLLEKSIAKEKELGSTWWKKSKFELIEVTIVGNN